MFFSFSFVSWGQIFGVFFAPFPEEEISDYIAHGPIIRVLTVPPLTRVFWKFERKKAEVIMILRMNLYITSDIYLFIKFYFI